VGAAYSRRFALGSGGAAPYTVPAGKRVVVKCVTVFNNSAATGSFDLTVASVPVLYDSLSPLATRVYANVTMCAEAGEVVVMHANAGIVCHASGYLLDA